MSMYSEDGRPDLAKDYSAKDTGVKSRAPKTWLLKRTTRRYGGCRRSRRLRRLPQATARREFVRCRCASSYPISSLCWRYHGLTAIRSRSKGSLRSLLCGHCSCHSGWIGWTDARVLRGSHTVLARNSTRLPISSISGCPALILYFWACHEMKSFGWLRRLFSRSPRRVRLAVSMS